MRKVYLVVFIFFIYTKVNGQAFSATYDFANVTTGTGTTDPTPVPVVPGLVCGSFNANASFPYSFTNPNAGGRFSFIGWSLGATNGSDVFTGGLLTTQYYQVTITPNANVNLDINSITFTAQRSTTGPRQYAVRGSVDAFAANLPASISPTNANLSVVPTNIFQIVDLLSSSPQNGSTITLDATYDNLTTAVTFRFYGFNAEAAGGSFGIDNVVINGTATYTGPVTDYYSKSAGNLTTLGTWGVNTDGSGATPANFTSDGYRFNVVNRASVTLDANWTVSGSSAKVITGDGVSPTELIIPNSAILAGYVDVTNLSTLRLENSTLPSFGTIATGSTVNYAQTASPYVVQASGLTFHHLKLTNGTKTFGSGTVTVNGNLEVDGVSGFNGSGSPFTTINLVGNFALTNGAAFEPIATGEGNRMTLSCTGSGTQTLSGGDFYLFRIATLASPATTLDVSMGASANVTLGNPSGGGLTLLQTSHTISLNGNSLTIYGAGIFQATHVGTISGNSLSNLTINKTAGFANIGSTGFTTGFQQLNNFVYSCSSPIGGNNLNLQSALTVNGDLTMTAGKILIGANDLTVKGSATGSTTSYVQTNSSGSFILSGVTGTRDAPIGNSTYNPLIVTNTSNHDWSLRVEDVLTVTDIAFASNVIKAVQREWHITPSVNPPLTGATIVFQYDDSDPTQIGALFNTGENVQVWREVGTDWIAAQVAQTASGSPGGVRTAIITNWSLYSPFAISNISAPLPVKLISFNVVKLSSSVANITWELAACCSKDARFELEKSTDGINFSSTAAIAGSETNRFYTYLDTRLGKGTTYYRLKATDADGKKTYSRVIVIINDKQGLMITTMAPNPVSNAATVSIASAKAGMVKFAVTDLSGRIIKQWQAAVAEGNSTLSINTATLTNGIYHLSATMEGIKTVIRFVKQ